MYSTIIKGFSNSHQNERAMTMWRKLCKEGVARNTIVYNAVIESQARVGATANMNELLEKMEADRVSPDTISCSTLVRGNCMAGDMDKAWDLFRTMQKTDMVKDVV